MSMQAVVDVQPQSTEHDTLVQRVAQLESELAELKTFVHRSIYPLTRTGVDNDSNGIVQLGISDHNLDINQIDPDNLVPIRMLTAEEVRQRLEELELQYDLDSEEFYRRWQKGKTDEIADKIGWSILYEDWLRIQSESKHEDIEVADHARQ